MFEKRQIQTNGFGFLHPSLPVIFVLTTVIISLGFFFVIFIVVLCVGPVRTTYSGEKRYHEPDVWILDVDGSTENAWNLLLCEIFMFFFIFRTFV